MTSSSLGCYFWVCFIDFLFQIGLQLNSFRHEHTFYVIHSIYNFKLYLLAKSWQKLDTDEPYGCQIQRLPLTSSEWMI